MKDQRNQLALALAALIKRDGPIHLSYGDATKAEYDDKVEIDFDNKKGVYTISLRGQDEQLGRRSEATGVSGREGDVGGSVPEQADVVLTDSGEVSQGDQHGEGED